MKSRPHKKEFSNTCEPTHLVEDLLDELVVEPARLLHRRALHGEERGQNPARGGAADNVEEVVHLI
jgi:hypothetical protein